MATIIKPNIAPELLSQLDNEIRGREASYRALYFQNNYLIGNLVRIYAPRSWWINLGGTEAKLYSGKISRCFLIGRKFRL